MVGGGGLPQRERGIAVRACAATFTVVNVALLVIGLDNALAAGLTTGQILVLALPNIALTSMLALVPWQRIFVRRQMPWVVRGTVALYLVGLVATASLTDGVVTEIGWLLAINLVYSALVLPPREHVVAAIVTASAFAVIALSAPSELSVQAVDIVAMIGLALLTIVGTVVIQGALHRAERARDDADTTARALQAALRATRRTTGAGVDDILDAALRAAARRDGDMAAAYLVDDTEARAVFHEVPEDLRVGAPDVVRGIVAGIAAHGSAALDFEGEHAALLPPDQRGRVRASIIAPIRDRDDIVIGAMTASRASGPMFSEGERVALELLADQVARGIVLSRQVEADRRAIEQLRALEALKQDFVATVSHELRTPLTIVTGLAETLASRDVELSPALRQQVLDRLRANAASLESVVTGLLDVAGIDRGLVSVTRQDVDIAELLQGVAERLQPMFDDHALDVEVDAHVVVDGDAGLLERVVENLLTNARRHTPAGTTVLLRARRDRTDIVVEVADDGQGIPHDELDRVMQRFVRGGDPNERPTRGLGLGLALADEVLRLHGSCLEVASEVGTGTTFSFRLATVPDPVGQRRDHAGVRSGAGS